MQETDGKFSLFSRLLFILYLLAFIPVAAFAEFDDIPHIPHVAEKAEVSFEFDYLYAAPHRAFAIAPGGAWTWQSGKETTEMAKQGALAACKQYTQQKCVLFAVDNDIVFDTKSWSSLWGPYKTRQQALRAKTGVALGEKFPDIKFTDPAGVSKTISQLKGKVVFVHFWGCWCPSCRHEFGSLIDMYRILRDMAGTDIEFVVLQMREPISQSRAWAKQNNVTTLPLSDSGIKDSGDTEITLANGKKMEDRELAKMFPASYVLDKHGVVVFSHMGSVNDWSEYVPFFVDVVKKSGK